LVIGKVTHEEAVQLSKELNIAEADVTAAIKRASIIQQELRSKCPHEIIIHVNDYVPGDYYNIARYYKDMYCSVCNELLNRVETGTGGYN
jgi:hypothetical protein